MNTIATQTPEAPPRTVEPPFPHAKILVVDDQEPNVRLLERLLAQAGYRDVTSTTDSGEVLGLCERLHPDMLLLDLHMPAPDGFEVLAELESWIQGPYRLPVLILTGDATPDVRRRALAVGARDFVSKPLDHVEVLLRVRNLGRTRALQLALEEHNDLLDQRVRQRTAELERARLETLERLARAAEYRDDATHEHAQRIGHVASALAKRLGLPDRTVELVRRAAPLHDIGKLAIPDSILLKPGRLTEEEFEVVKGHAKVGAQILSGSQSTVLQLAEQIAATHHEKWNGTGYPAGLAGEDIPIGGRLVAVADVFDALTHDRPYKSAWPVERAIVQIRDDSGTHFDPGVVEAFLDLDEAALPDPAEAEALTPSP